MQNSPHKLSVGVNFAQMSEKEDEKSLVSNSERRSWQPTFDVYVGRIPPDWTKVCMIGSDPLTGVLVRG